MIEAYSGFGNEGEYTGLRKKLEDRNVGTVYVCGLTYDFAVGINAIESS